jgi:hypothetical protein
MSSYLRVTEETDDVRPATQPAHAAAWEAQRTQELSPTSPPLQQPQQPLPAFHFQGERNDQQPDSPPVAVAVDVAPTTAPIPVSALFPMHALAPGGTVGGPVSVAALRSDPAVLAAFSAAEHDRQTLLYLSYAAILVGVAFVGGVVGGSSIWLGYLTRRSNLTLTDSLESFLTPPAVSGCRGRRNIRGAAAASAGVSLCVLVLYGVISASADGGINGGGVFIMSLCVAAASLAAAIARKTEDQTKQLAPVLQASSARAAQEGQDAQAWMVPVSAMSVQLPPGHAATAVTWYAQGTAPQPPVALSGPVGSTSELAGPPWVEQAASEAPGSGARLPLSLAPPAGL